MDKPSKSDSHYRLHYPVRDFDEDEAGIMSNGILDGNSALKLSGFPPSFFTIKASNVTTFASYASNDTWKEWLNSFAIHNVPV